MKLVDGELANSKILVIEDDEDTLSMLTSALGRAGFRRVTGEMNPYRAVDQFAVHTPDVVLIDYNLPPTNALEIMARIRVVDDPLHPAPIVMLTGSEDERIKKRALEAGVADFLNKQFDPTEMLLRLRNTLRTHHLLREVRQQKMWLEESVRVRTTELQQARREVLERLAVAAEFRDYFTGEHTRRVGRVSRLIARSMGSPQEFEESIEVAALLHDLGKIAIPDSILLKTGPLTPDEYAVVKRHPEIGAQILSGSSEAILTMAQEIALCHHERWDGRGYPRGLKGIEIPLCGRIVALADSYDAMRSERPYKHAMSHDAAMAEVIRGRGTQFDPDVVTAFVSASSFVNELYGNSPSEYSSIMAS